MITLGVYGAQLLHTYTAKLGLQKLFDAMKQAAMSDTDADAACLRLGRELFDISLHVYTYSSKLNDFFLLHGVTGAWALNQALPHCPLAAKQKALISFAKALLAAYIAQGRPPILSQLPCETALPPLQQHPPNTAKKQCPDAQDETVWTAITSRALKDCVEEDEHKIKLVFACKDADAYVRTTPRYHHQDRLTRQKLELYQHGAWTPYRVGTFGLKHDDT